MPDRPPIGLSLHIGLNEIDPARHAGFDGLLAGCENDARSMRRVAQQAGFEPTLLLTEQATADNVKACIRAIAAQLEPGDVFFLSFSGHGGQFPDLSGDELADEEGDDDEDTAAVGLDESWVLYDRHLIDDELWALWSELRPGVRVVVVADCCHSGTSIRDPGAPPPPASAPKKRGVDIAVAQATYRRNREVYQELLAQAAGDERPVEATVLLISACQDNQVAGDGFPNGAFTTELLQVLRDGRASSYRDLRDRVSRRMPETQSPNYYVQGAPNPVFEAQTPFTIRAATRSGPTTGPGLASATTTSVNLREQAGTDHPVLMVVPDGGAVTARANDGDWLYVQVGQATGWVAMSLARDVHGTQVGWSTTVTAASLNLRKGPSTSFSTVGAASQGAALDVVGWRDKWLEVRHGSGTAFVSARYTRSADRPAGATAPLPQTGPLTPAQVRQRRQEIASGPAAQRGAAYEALQAQVEYRSQRDNKATEGGKLIETTGGRMCNLTSLAMALSYLGIDNPDPTRQYEDALEQLRQDRDLPPRTWVTGWGGVANAMGADVEMIRDGGFTSDQAWWEEHVLPELRAGKGVIMSITGHIVRVEGVSSAGLVVDDPNGRSVLGAGTSYSFPEKNPYQTSGPLVGDSITWPWAEVARHSMFWVAALSRASRATPDGLRPPLPDLRDADVSDPADEAG